MPRESGASSKHRPKKYLKGLWLLDCPLSRAMTRHAIYSRQPALAPLVMLDVAVGLARADLVETEIEFLDVGVAAQLLGRTFQHDAAVLHHVAVVGDVEHDCCVLLDDENGEVALLLEASDDREDFLDDEGDRKSTRLNSSHIPLSRMPSSA